MRPRAPIPLPHRPRTRRPLTGRAVRSALAFGVAGVLLAGTPPAAGASDRGGDEETVIVVQPAHPGPPLSPLLTGVNNDQWFDHSHGLWEPDRGAPNQDVVAKTALTGIGLVRYPGGTPANLFDWKKAVGPVQERGCQTDGRPGNRAPRDSVYGPDEHMAFVTSVGAQASIMVSFARSTPDDAADWVEYMNAPLGTNPRGGTAWAEVRAANGHPEPYGVRFWEVGNEHDRPEQRYWMSPDTDAAMRQYAFGGTQAQQDQTLGKGCDFRPGVVSDGTPGQTFSVPYPPVVPDSQRVYVAGEEWREVADLSTAGPDATVYTIDDVTGEVRFGDGVHGRIPPAGARVSADYVSGPHAGFVDFYAAMKEADPTIDVCATWAPITAQTGLGGTSFPELLAKAGHAEDYDCLTVHPYTNFRRLFGDTIEYPRQMHDWHMLGEAEATRVLTHHARTVAEYGRADAYVTTSEFGALFFGSHDAREYPSWNTAMSHATYFASQWARLAELGVPWAEGNTLISEAPQGLRAVLGGRPHFVLTSEAVVRQALVPLLEGGGTVARNAVHDNPVVRTEPTAVGSQYDALVTTAVLDANGGLALLVINRHPSSDVVARVIPAGYRHTGEATISTVIGHHDDPSRESFESHNSVDHPDEVRLHRTTATVGSTSFTLTFPKHSVTLIELEATR